MIWIFTVKVSLPSSKLALTEPVLVFIDSALMPVDILSLDEGHWTEFFETVIEGFPLAMWDIY